MEGYKKVQAVKLIRDLNAKDKAFDAAIDAACKNLSSEGCRGMRQELATMGNRLSNDEKSNISALCTLAAGLAGGVAGNSLNAAGTGAVGGKVAVENNALGGSTPTTCANGVDILHGGGSVIGNSGSAAGGVAGAGMGAIIAEMFGDDDKETQSQPNAGKDLTDADKAELGGTGSGTGAPPPPENDPK
ncbi:VENN motif pre-toxin domain-containing protein [Ewingella sp. CoE-038-23]